MVSPLCYRREKQLPYQLASPQHACYQSAVRKKEKLRLLVIEDDQDLAEVIEKHFKSLGYHVECQHDAMGPLSRLRRGTAERCPWDVILTDLMMPGIDGIEFIKQMHELAPAVPVVLMTAHGGLETAVRAVREGAYDFVTKPLNFPKLAISLERATSFYELREENEQLREVIQSGSRIVAKSPAMKGILDLVQRVAKSAATVLITGESGTGKEVVARAIHDQSDRKDHSFVAINCAAIPETLLESELFGFVKGAFTGAFEKKIGLFEEADGGTLFLDEIGDLSPALQAKLLRVLQERNIKRIGETKPRAVNVRVLAATHRNLGQEVAEKRFREDLFFRLNVIPIRIPPLRERREDIIPLAEHFFKRSRVANHSAVEGFSKDALKQLAAMPWPGNVRELENCVERAVVLSQGTEIGPSDLSVIEEFEVATKALNGGALLDQVMGDGDTLPTLNELSLQYIEWVVRRVGGVREKARKVLDIDRKTLYKKLREIQCSPSEPGDAASTTLSI